ncbi:MAG: hypothetical protein R3B13_28915 [Polyangiaceae bacterium]
MRCGWMLLVLMVGGCGGAAPAAPASAPGGGEPGGDAPENQQYVTPSEPTYAQPPPGHPGGYGYPQGAKDDLQSNWGSFEAAASELSQAGNDCRLACKALASMRRSAARICELTEDADSDSCERARRRLREAEERVEKSCTCTETP